EVDVVGIDVGTGTGNSQVEVVVEIVFDIGSVFFEGDVRGNADLFELFLHHYGGVRQKRILRPGQDGGAESVGVAGVGEQLLGLGNVRRRRFHSEAGPVAGREDLQRRRTEPEHGWTQYGFPIDGEGDSLAHFQVAERLARHVESDEADVGVLIPSQGQAVVALENWNVLQWRILDEVNGPRANGGGACGVVGGDGHLDAVYIRLSALPVLRIALQNDACVGHVFLELERPRTVCGLGQIPVLLDRVFVDDDSRRMAQVGQEGGVRLLECERDGVLVRRGYGVNGAQQRSIG